MSALGLPTITSVKTVEEFKTILANNPGYVIIKFGAEWCAPCKKIDGTVHMWFDHLSKNNQDVQTILIDVDENLTFYGHLKSKKMVSGIPTILAYKKGNVSIVPDEIVVGANVDQIHLFFKRCLDKVNA
jgi:thiol:disulfide interchange protein